jgi:hypothetical protein
MKRGVNMLEVKGYSKSYINDKKIVDDISFKVDVEYENAREEVKNFINAKSKEEVVFTSGTTDSLNMIASGFFANLLEAGDEILITHWGFKLVAPLSKYIISCFNIGKSSLYIYLPLFYLYNNLFAIKKANYNKCLVQLFIYYFSKSSIKKIFLFFF